MRYPTTQEVESANDLQIRRWYMKLPPAFGEHQGKLWDTIEARHNNLPKLDAETEYLLRNGVALCPSK